MTPKIMDFDSSISKEYMCVMRRLPVAWDDYSKAIELYKKMLTLA